MWIQICLELTRCAITVETVWRSYNTLFNNSENTGSERRFLNQNKINSTVQVKFKTDRYLHDKTIFVSRF